MTFLPLQMLQHFNCKIRKFQFSAIFQLFQLFSNFGRFFQEFLDIWTFFHEFIGIFQSFWVPEKKMDMTRPYIQESHSIMARVT